MLEDAGQDAVSVATAWLHDTLEDTDLTAEEIESQVGSRVTSAVLAMTRQRDQTYRQLITAVLTDPVATVDKLADVIDHLEPERLSVLDEEGRARAASMRGRYIGALDVLVPACSDLVSRGILVPATSVLINRANALYSAS
jgi:(p)ppGpp synthase/HD superfamily hydrolase